MMRYIVLICVFINILACTNQSNYISDEVLTSPSGNIAVRIYTTPNKQLRYSVSRNDQVIILESELGLQLKNADFTQNVTLVGQSKIARVQDNYTMRVGKKSAIHYSANEQTYHLADSNRQRMDVVFRVSDDGVSFRYVFTGDSTSEIQFVKEASSFHFDINARAWLQPIAKAQTGWSNTNPSYEEHYRMDIAVGTASPLGSGWVFPALFHTGETWVVISEAGMDGSWHGSRLAHDSSGGKYKIDIPQAAEVFTAGKLLAHSKGEFISPWRIIVLGDLSTVMESTLGTDVAAPAISIDPLVIKPGHSSWSWPLLKDDFTVYDVQKQFIDYAAGMHWDYTLIDADWDKKIGYKKLADLVRYAEQRNVGILVWFNSSGDWNTTLMGPKSQLLTHEQRVAVFSRLQGMGVKGIKIDFFAGDGQSMIAYYVDILKDAAAHNLLVNFHGSTLPRGLQRTYPNLMTAEAIKGLEFTTFNQSDEDVVATHAVMAVFARNLFDPMDFTPVVFGDIPNIKRSTQNSFELAESVLFTSGIQHFAETPTGMATVPDYVKTFLQELPAEWDDVKFIDGYPGKFVVVARRSGNNWYLAGINAQEHTQKITLNLSFTGKERAVLIENGDSERSFNRAEFDTTTTQTIKLKPNSGFVIVVK